MTSNEANTMNSHLQQIKGEQHRQTVALQNIAAALDRLVQIMQSK